MNQVSKYYPSFGVTLILDEDDSHYFTQLLTFNKQHKTFHLSGADSPSLHRIIAKAQKGEWVDHKDGDTCNNSKENLRVCTKQQNHFNTPKTVSEHVTCRCKGVSKKSSKGRQKRYHARIMVNYKEISLGYFYTEEEAGRAYDEAARKYFGEFACVNFPQQSERGALN